MNGCYCCVHGVDCYQTVKNCNLYSHPEIEHVLPAALKMRTYMTAHGGFNQVSQGSIAQPMWEYANEDNGDASVAEQVGRVDWKEVKVTEQDRKAAEEDLPPELRYNGESENNCSENRIVFGDQATIPALTRVDEIDCSENRVVLGDQAMIPALKRLRTSPTHRDYAIDEKGDPFFHDPSRKQTRTAHPHAATTPAAMKHSV